MILYPLKNIKNDLKEMFPKIYGDISFEELVKKTVYSFKEERMNEYKHNFYLSVYSFLNGGKYNTSQFFWKQFLSGIHNESFIDLFIKEVNVDFFNKSTKIK